MEKLDIYKGKDENRILPYIMHKRIKVTGITCIKILNTRTETLKRNIDIFPGNDFLNIATKA
jgi:hypothetical protein